MPYWYIDTGFAALLMLLAAVDEGLGAVFFGIPPEKMVAFRSEFGVPSTSSSTGAAGDSCRPQAELSQNLLWGQQILGKFSTMRPR